MPRQPVRNKYGGVYCRGSSYGHGVALWVIETYKTTQNIIQTAQQQVSPEYARKQIRCLSATESKLQKRRELDRWFLWYCVLCYPDLYLWEMQLLLWLRQHRYYSLSLIGRTLKKMGLTRKLLSHLWLERRQERLRWKQRQQQLTPDQVPQLIFIDESSVDNTTFSRRYGRAPGPKRAHGWFPKARKNRVRLERSGGISLCQRCSSSDRLSVLHDALLGPSTEGWTVHSYHGQRKNPPCCA